MLSRATRQKIRVIKINHKIALLDIKKTKLTVKKDKLCKKFCEQD